MRLMPRCELVQRLVFLNACSPSGGPSLAHAFALAALRMTGKEEEVRSLHSRNLMHLFPSPARKARALEAGEGSHKRRN